MTKIKGKNDQKGFSEATLRVIEALEGDLETGKCFCPVHDDGSKPSLHVKNGERQPVVLHCFGGGQPHDDKIIEWLKARGAWPSSNRLRSEHAAGTQQKSKAERRNHAVKIWNDLIKSSGQDFAPVLKEYLRPRGIKRVPTPAMMVMPVGYSAESTVEAYDFGMVLPICNSAGKLMGIQATWLKPDLTAKREGEPQRQSYGLIKDNFVELVEMDYSTTVNALLIGEGVETTLAGMQLTGFPGVATAGAWNIIKPPRSRRYIILADNGDAGQKFARDQAARIRALYPNAVMQIATPVRPEKGKAGYDWNDALMQGRESTVLKKEILNAPEFNDDKASQALAREISDAERIDQLAQLDTIGYEKRFKDDAKQMGILASALDKLVKKRREELAAEDATGFLQPVEPWPKSVDGSELLNDLCEVITQHIILGGKEQDLAIALWVLHAHALDASRHSPVLLISSPTKRCGKTQLLELLSRLVPKALSAANVTAATVFRAIARYKPTLLIDESDTFLSDKSELRGVLNSGHTRSQAFVLRCVGEDLIPTQFSTWSPKAFAAIGRLHPTLEDRSITIALKRKLSTEKVKRFPKAEGAYRDLQRKCTRWVNDHFDGLVKATPKLPALNDRASDNWEPLLAIAEACGDDWAEEARTVAVKLSGVDDDETYSILLLQDLRKLFKNNRCEEEGTGLPSSQIVLALTAMEGRPWPEFLHGKAITAHGIARMLKPFKIFPKRVRTERGWSGQNGYSPDQFKIVFKRYLPEKGKQISHSHNTQGFQHVPPKTKLTSMGD